MNLSIASFVVGLCVFVHFVSGYVIPQFESMHFKVGIEYDHSLPMRGGSERYRHRNNYDPFFVTITVTVKKYYVISYLEVKSTVDQGGNVTFNLIRGQTGSKTMVFQLVSENTDFLSYSYLCYGIKEEEYKKINNIITLPISSGQNFQLNLNSFLLFTVLHPLLLISSLGM